MAKIDEDWNVYCTSLGSLSKDSIVATGDISAVIDRKAPLVSPEFEGQPLAPDPTSESQPGQIANIGYVNKVIDGKRDKTDLAVYEQADYWEGTSTSGAIVNLPLVSSSGYSKTYSNGSTNSCYKLQADDYRTVGGVFRVYLRVNRSGTWATVSIAPETSFDEITEVTTKTGSPAYTFKHHAEAVPEQDNFLATTKEMAGLLEEKVDKEDATLTEKWTVSFALTEEQKEMFSQDTPSASDNDYALTVGKNDAGTWTLYVGSYNAASLMADASGNLVFDGGDVRLNLQPGDLVATFSGYILGPDDLSNPNYDKPLASAEQGTKADNTAIAPEFSNSSTYAVDEVVMRGGVRYRCTTAVAAAGPWTGSDNWTAESVQEAMDAGDEPQFVKELYNDALDTRADGDGQVFKAEISGNYWTWGTNTWRFTSKETSGGKTFYNYGTGLNTLTYSPDTGLLTNAYGQTRCQCGTGLDPLAGDDISPIDGTTDYKFTKLAPTWPTVPSDLFASISDIAAFSTTKSYAVGDIAGYGGRVYKCTVMHTGEWDASHFTSATKLEMQAYLAERGVLTFSSWWCVPAELTDPLTSQKLSVEVRYEDNAWELLVVGGSGEPLATVTPGDPDARSLEFSFVWNNEPTTVTATRAYQLRDQSDKPIQPAGNYLAKEDIVAPSTSASDSGKAADAKATGDALAGKLDKSGGVELENSEQHPGAFIIRSRVGNLEKILSIMDRSNSGMGWDIVLTGSDPDTALRLPTVGGTVALISNIPDVSGYATKAPNPTSGNLAALDADGNPTDSTWTAGDLARYALTTKTISNNAVTLDDRACNYVDARSLGSSNTLDIDFPALVDGKARGFVLAVECGANPPTISYAAFATIMAEDASSLTPEEGMNIYSFKEFKTNMFVASRKLVVTVVDNSSENG